MTLHTKPAEAPAIISQHTIVAELASAFALVTLGSSLPGAASPPLRLAARARIVLNEAVAVATRQQPVGATPARRSADPDGHVEQA